MKNLFFAFLVLVSFASCADDTDSADNTQEATILGRWVLEGLETTTRYDFTTDKRYTVYSDTEGEFPTEAEVIANNPVALTHNWEYSGDTVVVDLNFGNYFKGVPTFRCDNNVLVWMMENGQEGDTLYREGHDINDCN